MEKRPVVHVSLNLQKIFLTPPNTRKEKIACLVLMLMLFVLFFAPICFSTLHPVKAVLLACAPTLSLSWGWLVLMRALFRKGDFSK